ncbi:hypothetical protein HAX54_034275 [Datura stramonium]|uniref:Uncharacterized protein n=1 Tax=Datura stramonium TaxID=4076 RepID=A0ABS8VGJ2_DATST|nr:hypothetical protein [Datura stramonium]
MGRERSRKIAKVHPPVEGPVEFIAKTDGLKSTSFFITYPIEISRSSSNKLKDISHENSFREAKEVEYEGEDEHDDSLLMNRDSFDFDIQNINEKYVQSVNKRMNLHHLFNDYITDRYPKKSDENFIEITMNGNASDPGIVKREYWTSMERTRSCSDLERRYTLKKINCELPPPKSQSFEEIHRLDMKFSTGSPVSVSSHYSADNVMLKKHSSSQVLPSRSRNLWWKIFLWSHRNVKRTCNTQRQPIPVKITVTKQGGYSSDTLEPRHGMELSKLGSPGSFIRKSLKKESNNNEKHPLHDIHVATGVWPQNQWVACPAESSTFSRVDEWVKDLFIRPPQIIKDESDYPPSPHANKSLARNSSLMTRRPNTDTPEDVIYANNVIQSLNSSSTIAHVAEIGLKVNPIMSHFSSLRSVNLSGNSIVQIIQGSLPKSLHVINLSRNHIHTIEGLKEFTHLQSISDDQLRKIVCSLFQKLVFLNKQPINPQKGREQAIAEAVLGNNN